MCLRSKSKSGEAITITQKKTLRKPIYLNDTGMTGHSLKLGIESGPHAPPIRNSDLTGFSLQPRGILEVETETPSYRPVELDFAVSASPASVPVRFPRGAAAAPGAAQRAGSTLLGIYSGRGAAKVPSPVRSSRAPGPPTLAGEVPRRRRRPGAGGCGVESGVGRE